MTTPAAKLLVSDVYRTGLNVWCFSFYMNRLRQFPTGQIINVEQGSSTLKDSYPFDDKEGVPLVTIQHDNNEGNTKRKYRIDEVLIVEDTRSDDVIDAIMHGIDTILTVNRIEVNVLLAQNLSPPDGDQPGKYRDGVVSRGNERKRTAIAQLREGIIKANIERHPHDLPDDGLERLPTDLYDNLWAAIDHKIRESENLAKLINDGILPRHLVPQSDLPENLPTVFAQFLKHHEEASHNMGPAKRQAPVMASSRTTDTTPSVARAPPTPNVDLEESIPMARKERNERTTVDETVDRKPAPQVQPNTLQDDVGENDENNDTPKETFPLHNVAAKINPEIEPSNFPKINELKKLYDNLQPLFAGMYDIADDDDPRAPILSYATWKIYLVAAGTQGRSKLNDKEWYVIENEYLKPYRYGIQTAMAYHNHADPDRIENNNSTRPRKALTFVSAAMNTLMSGAVGLLDDNIRSKLDSTIRGASTGTPTSTSVINDLHTFVEREKINTVLPESVVGWMRCGHILGTHVNKAPATRVHPPAGTAGAKSKKRQPATHSSGAKSMASKKASHPTEKSIDLTTAFNKRQATDTPSPNPVPKKIKVTLKPNTPDDKARKTTGNVAISPATRDAAATKTPPSTAPTGDATPKKKITLGSQWKPPTTLEQDYGPPGYIRVAPYLYVKGHRVIRSRFDKWKRLQIGCNHVFLHHASAVAKHADAEKLSPDEPFYPVDHSSQLCFIHPTVRELYRLSSREGSIIDLEHAADFCKRFAATQENMTCTHQSYFGRSERSIEPYVVPPVDEANITEVCNHAQGVQEVMDSLRASWFTPSLDFS
jgi:hypothetical protein